MKYEAHVASDLYNAGYAEDGQPVIGEMYYVVIENADGRRFRHERNFCNTKANSCEYGDFFSDLSQEAKAAVERLSARVNAALAAGKRLSAASWYEVQAAYGSKAYIDGNWERDLVEWEKAVG